MCRCEDCVTVMTALGSTLPGAAAIVKCSLSDFRYIWCSCIHIPWLSMASPHASRVSMAVAIDFKYKNVSK